MTTLATPPENETQRQRFEEGVALRRQHRGLVGIQPKVLVRDKDTLSRVYTPGVAKPCLEIARDHLTSFDYTIRGNTVAVISDGSSVYGLGNVGPYAALPMLEAKAVFHKELAGIDAVPIALDTQDIDEIVETVRYLSPTFGGIHLEDISAPRCFAIVERLRQAVSLPIFHTDQQGTAVAVFAALTNALRLVDKKLENVRVVINGAGAAGTATAEFLLAAGVGDLKVCDRNGVLFYRRTRGLNWKKSQLARRTNPKDVLKGALADALVGADVFIGLSSGNLVTPEMVATMAHDAIVFAMALPTPEISYEAAKAAGARIVATGGSQAPNQINSTLAYPGIFRGALDTRAVDVNREMFLAAAQAMAGLVPDNTLAEDRILPDALDGRVAVQMAEAVAQAAIESGVAQVQCAPGVVGKHLEAWLEKGPEAWVEPPSQDEATMPVDEASLALHKRYHGMVEVKTYLPLREDNNYSLVYSAPGATWPCQLVQNTPEAAYDLTSKHNLVAIVTDGSAVLGLGNIGPGAGLPVMEGKAVLFKTFGGVEAFPICLRTQEVDELVETVARIAPVFGGINLEDIAAPRCFEVEERLIERLDIPVFHDDQHGTAVVVMAGILNAVKLKDKPLKDMKIVFNGAGAAALSVSQLLMQAGAEDIVIADTRGLIYEGRPEGMNPFKDKIARITNHQRMQGSLEDALKGADIFIGLSVPNTLSQDMVRTMAAKPIIFALSNPTPEIMPDLAYEAGACVVATGRSDFANQVNNSLAFPGIFRGALDTRSRCINDAMKIAAANAIAGLITAEQREQEHVIIPGAFDWRVPPAVAKAVAQAAMDTGVARIQVNADDVARGLAETLAKQS